MDESRGVIRAYTRRIVLLRRSKDGFGLGWIIESDASLQCTDIMEYSHRFIMSQSDTILTVLGIDSTACSPMVHPFQAFKGGALIRDRYAWAKPGRNCSTNEPPKRRIMRPLFRHLLTPGTNPTVEQN